jgi:hypothetical protein
MEKYSTTTNASCSEFPRTGHIAPGRKRNSDAVAAVAVFLEREVSRTRAIRKSPMPPCQGSKLFQSLCLGFLG